MKIWDSYLTKDTEGDFFGALAELKKLAISGNTNAMFLLGQEFGVYSRPEITNYSKAAYWFKSASELSDLNARYEYGVACALELGVKGDLKMAKNLILSAAQGGNELAIDALLGYTPNLLFLNFELGNEDISIYEKKREFKNH